MSREANVLSGTFAKAPLFGAKTVKEPFASNVSTKLAALTAVTRVDKLFVSNAAPAIDGRF